MTLKKKSKKRSTLKKSISKKTPCNPALNSNKQYTCYSDSNLKKMKDLYNSKHKLTPIRGNTSREIWEELRDRYHNSCETERCWLKKEFSNKELGNEIISHTFASKAPVSWKKNKNEWLSSDDLIKVMNQHEKQFPEFLFIGPSPIDFDKIEGNECVWNELCQFNLKNILQKRKKKIGIIFNTDTHDKSGEHWITSFINCDCEKPYFFYFDSNGDKIMKEVKILADRIIEQGKEIGIDIQFDENYPKIHQQGDTECGIYSLYLITQLLKGLKSPEYFKTSTIPDKEMEELRSYYFDLN